MGYLYLCKEEVCRKAFLPVSLGQPEVGDSEDTGRDVAVTSLVSLPSAPQTVV